jgi:hypothetical protein
MILGYSTVGALLASRNLATRSGAMMKGAFRRWLCDEYATYTYVTTGSHRADPAAWFLN